MEEQTEPSRFVVALVSVLTSGTLASLVALIFLAMIPVDHDSLTPEVILVMIVLSMGFHALIGKHSNLVKALQMLTTFTLLYPLSRVMILFGHLDEHVQLLLSAFLLAAYQLAASQLDRADPPEKTS